MLNPDEQQTITRNIRVMKAIWFAMLASLGIYAAIPSILLSTGFEPLGLEVIPMLRMTFTGVSVLTAISTAGVHGMLIRAKGSPGVRAGDAADIVFKAVKLHMTAMIIALAMCESIGVYGLVLFFLGDSTQVAYMFLAGAGLLMLRYMPNQEKVEEFAERLKTNSPGAQLH